MLATHRIEHFLRSCDPFSEGEELTQRRKIAPMPAGAFRTEPRLIASRQNPRVKELRAALARSGRTPRGLIAIEGEHLVAEAMRSRLRFATVFRREGYASHTDVPDGAE